MRLTPSKPFDFERTLRFLLHSPMPAKGRQSLSWPDYFEKGEYRRVITLSGEPALYGVRMEPDGTDRALRVRIIRGRCDAASRAAVAELVSRQFGLPLDLRPFYRLAQGDPVLSRLLPRFRGTRIPQTPRPFEALVAAVLGQQVNVTFARQVKAALVRAFGVAIEFCGQLYYAFPEPEALAISSAARLRKLQISAPKAEYIIGLSRAVLDGRLDLERLRELPPAEATRRLREHPGVGPWTAEYVGMRGLEQRDCLPAQDAGLQKAIQFFYGLRRRASPLQAERLARNWAGWRSYGTFYLWLAFREDPAWRARLRAKIAGNARRSKR